MNSAECPLLPTRAAGLTEACRRAWLFTQVLAIKFRSSCFHSEHFQPKSSPQTRLSLLTELLGSHTCVKSQLSILPSHPLSDQRGKNIKLKRKDENIKSQSRKHKHFKTILICVQVICQYARLCNPCVPGACRG